MSMDAQADISYGFLIDTVPDELQDEDNPDREGIDFVLYGEGESHVVAIGVSVITAYDWAPEMLDLTKFKVDSTWEPTLREFCKKHKIKLKKNSKAGWYLTAWYG